MSATQIGHDEEGRGPIGRWLQERRLALGQEVVLAHKPLNFLGIHHHALTPESRCHPPVAIETVLEANTLDKIAQLALTGLIAASGEVPVIRRARQACEPAQALHIGVRTGCLQCHGFNDFDDAAAGLPCAAGRSKARKAFRKKSMSSCWRPTSRSSSAIRELAWASAERFVSAACSGLSLRGPGLGPRLRFNPSGPWAFHALIQSCRSLRDIPSLRATGRTPSPPSARLIAFNLNAVGN